MKPSEMVATLRTRKGDPLRALDAYASADYGEQDSVGALAADPELSELLGPDTYGGDEFAGWWSSVKKAAKKVGKVANKVRKNEAFKWGLRGVAFAVPAVAPAVVALEAANLTLDQAERGVGQAKATIQATIDAAKRGDTAAKEGLRHLAIARKTRDEVRAAVRKHQPQRKPAAKHAAGTPGILIGDDGRVLRGVWVQA